MNRPSLRLAPGRASEASLSCVPCRGEESHPSITLHHYMIRYFTAGESHGVALVGIVEGLPDGIPLSAAYIDRNLNRRWHDFGRGGRAKNEQVRIQIHSALRLGLNMW